MYYKIVDIKVYKDLHTQFPFVKMILLKSEK
jgi:hypothetical protein